MLKIATNHYTANHMAVALKEQNVLFAGDHVMGWATTIVAPPDGAMSDYMASLDKLALQRRIDEIGKARSEAPA